MADLFHQPFFLDPDFAMQASSSSDFDQLQAHHQRQLQMQQQQEQQQYHIPFHMQAASQHYVEMNPQHYSLAMHPMHSQSMMLQERPEDCIETSTKPRLNKGQVEKLESSFQANAKPNSNLKKELAAKTQLPLARISNWFQNRRAKAKQLKKQEEYESQEASKSHDSCSAKSIGSADAVSTEDLKTTSNNSGSPSQSHTASDLSFTPPARPKSSTRKDSITPEVTISRPKADLDLHAFGNPGHSTILPHDLQDQPENLGAFKSEMNQAFEFTGWEGDVASSFNWDSSHGSGSMPHHDLRHQMSNDFSQRSSSQDSVTSAGQYMSPDPMQTWTELGLAPEEPPSFASHSQFRAASMPTLLQPNFGSRNNSETSQIADAFSNFDLSHASQSSTPVAAHFNVPMVKTPDGSTTSLAARRKRPRPAAIGAAALRSRSYGPASLSPNPMLAHSSSNHAIRHVKSTGHNLNARFSGISKSRPQRSPLNYTTFAEAGVFGKTIAEEPSVTTPSSVFSPPTPLTPSEIPQYTNYMASHSNIPTSPFVPMINGLPLTLDSPPDTPMNNEVLGQMQLQSWMNAAMSTSQHEQILEYTPPYSAGPLTGNSMTHSPMASPDFTPSSKPIQMPRPTHVSPIAYNNYPSKPQDPTPHPAPSPRNQGFEDMSMGLPESASETSFFMHTFPEQKEAHRQAAQQMPSAKPKVYMFANQTPATFHSSPAPSNPGGL